MKRRDFLTGLAGAVAGTPALAQDIVSSIVRQLKKQGFRSVIQERTLLGRVRIIAARDDGRREIIVNPKTGEILRDLWTPVAGSASEIGIIGDKGGSGDDDDDDDDGGHDDDDDDDGGDDDDDGGGDDDDDHSGEGGGGGGDGSDDDDDDDDDDDNG